MFYGQAQPAAAQTANGEMLTHLPNAEHPHGAIVHEH
jgi:hypothetical protein